LNPPAAATVTAHRGFGLSDLGLRQKLGTFYDMSKKQIIEFSRYPVAFVALFVQIFLIIVMFLFATLAFSGSSGTAGQGQLAGVMVYGFLVSMFLSFTLWEVGFSIREEQVRGTLESLYLSPANKFNNLVSRIFAILMFAGVMCVAAVVFVGAMVGGMPMENVAFALLVLALSISGFLGIGFIFAGVTVKLKETAQFLVSFLQFFFMIFSAVFFPFSALPAILRDNISRYLPVSYSVDLFRSLLIAAPEPELMSYAGEFYVVLAFGIVSPIVGYVVYRWIERQARTAGTLGEY